MMLNSLRASVVDSVCSMPGGLPQLVSGHSVLLGGEEYTALKKVTARGFGTIYTCKHGEETRVLKVQTFTSMHASNCCTHIYYVHI